jgi:hypothetical protein
MTKKDYELIAKALETMVTTYATRAEKVADEKYETTSRATMEAQLSAVCFTIEQLAQELGADNPRFNRAIFVKACGLN